MKNIYGTYSVEPTQLELRNRALARQAAAEGFVLLKNENNALPLKNRKIALYGMGARKTVKGGLGSGSVEERYSVNIEDGLKNAGYEITTQDWLNDYDAEYTDTYQQYRDMVEEKIKGLTNPMQIIPLAHSYVYRYPSGRLVSREDVEKSNTDTAIYVLMRQAGECNDRKLEKGDYYITDIERENLKFITKAYAHTVLIINVGGHLDMEFLDELPGIDAVVLFVQGGEEGGNALADVLSGKVNFSGKLADTIPVRYEDIPFGDEFSYLNGDVQNEYYKEGIYVGYRYFDSFRKPVRYPFGFGLSYTEFTLTATSVSLNGKEVNASIKVTNTGNVSGREVVQIYVSPPGENKEYQRLIAFAKTSGLAPGTSETVTLTFDIADCASYCEQKAIWLLDAGSYILRIGNSSRNTTVVSVIQIPQSIVIRQCRNCCGATDDLPDFHPDAASEAIPEACPVITVDPKAFVAEVISYTEPVFEETAREKEILDALTAEEMAWLLQGGDLQTSPKGAFEIAGASGKTTTKLLDKNIPNVLFADGPAGVNISDQLKELPDGSIMAAKIPERYDWGVLRTMKAQIERVPGKPLFRYATAWPVEMLLAQTWNTNLLHRIGKAVGEEMVFFGITLWLAPGMNIHRNPLGGRAFEYYSEDPVLTGEMAAALTLGVQGNRGVGVSLKHFCCNNSEDNRNGISANVSERALREIYLKGFEIAVRKSRPKTVMSSYNMVNHVYTANRRDLLTDILRCEWGFDGLVMTDWGSTKDIAARPELAAPAGNDLIMPGSDFDRQRILKGISDGTISCDVLRKCACRVLRIILESNTAGVT